MWWYGSCMTYNGKRTHIETIAGTYRMAYTVHSARYDTGIYPVHINSGRSVLRYILSWWCSPATHIYHVTPENCTFYVYTVVTTCDARREMSWLTLVPGTVTYYRYAHRLVASRRPDFNRPHVRLYPWYAPLLWICIIPVAYSGFHRYLVL